MFFKDAANFESQVRKDQRLNPSIRVFSLQLSNDPKLGQSCHCKFLVGARPIILDEGSPKP